MPIIPATPYRIKNVASGNVMAESTGWTHNNGLFAYGGDQQANDQLWVFVLYEGYYKITNYNYLGWVIANTPGNICVYRGDDNDDQHWQIDGSGGSDNYITIFQNGNAIIDPNPGGSNGSLSTAPVTSHDNRAVWMAIAEPVG